MRDRDTTAKCFALQWDSAPRGGARVPFRSTPVQALNTSTFAGLVPFRDRQGRVVQPRAWNVFMRLRIGPGQGRQATCRNGIAARTPPRNTSKTERHMACLAMAWYAFLGSARCRNEFVITV
jgi:hypothetical protein